MNKPCYGYGRQQLQGMYPLLRDLTCNCPTIQGIVSSGDFNFR